MSANNTQQGEGGGLLRRLRRGLVGATDRKDGGRPKEVAAPLAGDLGAQGQGHALAINAPEGGERAVGQVKNAQMGVEMAPSGKKTQVLLSRQRM